MREAGAAEHKVAGRRWVWVSEAQSQISETEPYARGTGSSNPISSTEESASRRVRAVTTAGVFSPEPLRSAIDAMGLDHVLFSVDSPLED
jgi:hypothetical protein